MRFALLGSGSRGNGLLVEEGGTCLLVDCGFTLKETERRLARLGKEPRQISAVLVTHEHGDHIGGIGALARRHRISVWMTHGTLLCHGVRDLPKVETFNSHLDFAIGDLAIRPYPVPHDAREPVQFVFGNGASRLALLTDSGRVTPHMREQLEGCDALVLECNHDEQMLADGPYPPRLQARVGGELGHLSNRQAGELLKSLDCSRLQQMVGAHLSEKNNTQALAREALSIGLGCEAACVSLADQEKGLDWRTVV